MVCRSTVSRGCVRRCLRRSDVFVATLTEKLMIYALGRGLEHYDMPAVRTVTAAAAQNDNAFSSLILGIVRSVPFQMRTVGPGDGAPVAADVASR